MLQTASLIDELEEALAQGPSERRIAVLRQVTDLFIDKATVLDDAKIDIFDDVISYLATRIEESARRGLANTLADVSNAPIDAVNALARDDSIAVSGPILQRSLRVGEDVLLDVARTKGQDHLMAISKRVDVCEALTDVIVERGNAEVTLTLAGNYGARFSKAGYGKLADRTRGDDELAQVVGARRDIPLPVFKQIIMHAKAHVQQKLLVHVKPVDAAAIRAAIDQAASKVETENKPQPRDYGPAQRRIFVMARNKQLHEENLRDFAQHGQIEETVCALSALCAIDIPTAERLVTGDTSDSIVILARASGFMFETVRSLMRLSPNPSLKSQVAADEAFASFEKLTETAAQRVVRFWQVRVATEKTG